MGLINLLTGQKKLSPSEKKFVIKQEKELATALHTMNTTDDLQKFFKNYRIAEDAINQIKTVAGEKTKCIAGASPKECMESLQRDYVKPLHSCLDMYIRKETVRIMGLSRGRIKATDGVEAIIMEYATNMPPDCIDFAKVLIGDMKKKIEKLEEK